MLQTPPPHIPNDPHAPPPRFVPPPPPPRYFFVIVVIAFVSGAIGGISYAAFGPAVITTLETRVERLSDTVKESVVLRVQESVVQLRVGASEQFSVGTVFTSDGWVVGAGVPSVRAKQIFTRPAERGAVTKIVSDPATGLTFFKTTARRLRVLNMGSMQDMERGTRLLIVLPHTALPVTLQDTQLCVVEKCPSVLSDKLSHAISLVESFASGTVDGAPVVTARGEFVGIAATMNGRTVAIPFSAVEPILEKLFLEERVVRPALGVRAINTTASPIAMGDRVVTRGFLIEYVSREHISRFTILDLRAGDIIEAWRSQPIESHATLFDLVAREHIGAQVPVTVRRGAKLLEINLTIGSL